MLRLAGAGDSAAFAICISLNYALIELRPLVHELTFSAFLHYEMRDLLI
jgi:hypothetical protein